MMYVLIRCRGGLRQADAPRHLAQQITPKGLLPNEDAPHDLFSFGCKMVALFSDCLTACLKKASASQTTWVT